MDFKVAMVTNIGAVIQYSACPLCCILVEPRDKSPGRISRTRSGQISPSVEDDNSKRSTRSAVLKILKSSWNTVGANYNPVKNVYLFIEKHE
jgi:hypothetical protein